MADKDIAHAIKAFARLPGKMPRNEIFMSKIPKHSGLSRLWCLLGWHKWQLTETQELEPDDTRTTPTVLWRPGGMIYFGNCECCGKTRKDDFRGFWEEPEYAHKKLKGLRR